MLLPRLILLERATERRGDGRKSVRSKNPTESMYQNEMSLCRSQTLRKISERDLQRSNDRLQTFDRQRLWFSAAAESCCNWNWFCLRNLSQPPPPRSLPWRFHSFALNVCKQWQDIYPSKSERRRNLIIARWGWMPSKQVWLDTSATLLH